MGAAWYSIELVIPSGGSAFLASSQKAFTLGPYILQTLLFFIAPTLYVASIYMEFGRIVLLTNGDAYCFLPRRWLTKIFLLGDIISFVMQGAGSGNADALTTGENIIIAGLVIQLFFFSLFVYTSLSFLLRLRRRSDGGSSSKLLDPNPACWWQRHMYALYTGNGLILVRSLFRLNRVYLYLFDAVLMVLVMVIFACVYPGELEVLAL
ncbi:RTA-like protein [Aspergillus fruticulosus]